VDAEDLKRAAQEQVEALQSERTAILARLDWLERKLEAWNVILEDEGNSTPPRSRTKPERGQRAKIIELVKELIMASGKTGMLPREIRAELLKQGIQANSQVVSNALSRWKKRDYTVEIEGRHYWKAYLSDIELQKVKPRKRRGLTQRSWEPPTVSPIKEIG